MSFSKRQPTLKKKVEELKTLCAVTICMVCFGPDGTVETYTENATRLTEVLMDFNLGGIIYGSAQIRCQGGRDPHRSKTHFISSLFRIFQTILLSLLLNPSSLISQRKQENMAAELFLTFAMQETFTRVSSIAAEGIRLAWGLKGHL
ncbi:hypothetical protein SADUNF_Sadunf13G0106500 [Salix dunnii]|uniref:MADS-box domain-containing protein n=1 Tax=Salix dunnii TaxID=1413687 RepID=A0A835JK80_9ROSI|nr:hypothetical protein SADUNF_Sadunf13G0106500 [Salix dunnii]